MKRHHMIAGLALVAAFAIAIPAIANSGSGATTAKKKKKKPKVGPRGPAGAKGATGPQGPPGAAGLKTVAAAGLITSALTNQGYAPSAGNCYTNTFNAPGVQPGDVVSVNMANNAISQFISVMPATNTIPAANQVNLAVCNNSNGNLNIGQNDLTFGFVAFR